MAKRHCTKMHSLCRGDDFYMHAVAKIGGGVYARALEIAKQSGYDEGEFQLAAYALACLMNCQAFFGDNFDYCFFRKDTENKGAEMVKLLAKLVKEDVAENGTECEGDDLVDNFFIIEGLIEETRNG